MSHRHLVLGACSCAALMLSPAWAAGDFPTGTAPSGAHYGNGASQPACNIDTDSVDCTGTMISGVGNTDAKIVLAATASLTVRCRNNGGQIVDVKTSVQTSATDTAQADAKNGTMVVDPISVNLPTTQTLVAAAKCPNKNWTKEPLGTATYGYTYTLTFKNFSSPAISLP